MHIRIYMHNKKMMSTILISRTSAFYALQMYMKSHSKYVMHAMLACYVNFV